MSYTKAGMGAVGFGVSATQDVKDRAIEVARPRLGDMLAQLESIASSVEGGDRLKLVSSANPTVAGQPCSGTPCQTVTSPTLWDGSNVVVWPASDYNDLASAWSVAHDYVGTKGAFALDLTSVAKAIAALRALISAVDVKMRFRGLTIKHNSSNYWLWLLAGLGVLGVAVATRKSKGKARRGRRTTRRRR